MSFSYSYDSMEEPHSYSYSYSYSYDQNFNTTYGFHDTYTLRRYSPLYWAVNASICVVSLLSCLWFVRRKGFDGPIREDGVASDCGDAFIAAHTRRQGRVALFWMFAPPSNSRKAPFPTL